DIDITDDERACDPAEADACDFVQVRERQVTESREYPADIDKRGHLQVQASGGYGNRADSLPHLGGRRECIAIIEASCAIPAQRLGAADLAQAAAERAERPERRIVGREHVPQRRVEREDG